MNSPLVQHLSAREGYDRWAEVYDDENNPLIALEERHLPAVLGELRGLTVIDLGCGTGRQSARLARAGASVTAVDFSEGMLARARGRADAAGIRFLLHDVHSPVPAPNGAFDRVVSCLVLEHVDPLLPFFAECRRLCRRGGSVVFSAMHPAMLLRGISARFTDPATGAEVRPRSLPHQLSDFVMAAMGAGLTLDHISEHAVDEELAQRCPRAVKYLGWPMLLLMRFTPAAAANQSRA
ncbi:MAG: methyltransferase domain-containing protein [Phycisphaerales bacterium]|nr:methyltransferase domain-containing protein [Phycisphaerales bacterium]